MGLIKLLNRPLEDVESMATRKGPLCDDPCAEHMLRTGGYCKLLHEANLWEEDAVSAATELLHQDMAFVPGGPVTLQNLAVVDGSSDESGGFELDEPSFFVDRYAVTNAQFQRFVDAGAYRDESFWPDEVQPFVFQLVDSTGTPGPAYWQDGMYDPDKRDHPVVGVSWHEANAFAHWLGKKLPTSAQWQRAGTWWKAGVRYPWGESYETGRSNTYASGTRDTIPVSSYGDSATPNGIVQLVGNVWEWVDGCVAELEFEGRIVEIADPLGEIRGGAFDTYFVSQATCLFRSGQTLLTRSDNVGFRCVASAELLQEVEAPE